jgi:hypothetical protein
MRGPLCDFFVVRRGLLVTGGAGFFSLCALFRLPGLASTFASGPVAALAKSKSVASSLSQFNKSLAVFCIHPISDRLVSIPQCRLAVASTLIRARARDRSNGVAASPHSFLNGASRQYKARFGFQSYFSHGGLIQRRLAQCVKPIAHCENLAQLEA